MIFLLLSYFCSLKKKNKFFESKLSEFISANCSLCNVLYKICIYKCVCMYVLIRVYLQFLMLFLNVVFVVAVPKKNDKKGVHWNWKPMLLKLLLCVTFHPPQLRCCSLLCLTSLQTNKPACKKHIYLCSSFLRIKHFIADSHDDDGDCSEAISCSHSQCWCW